jgi:hypothetical protein
MKLKALSLTLVLIICVGVLSACSSSVAGKYSGGDCTLTLNEDNTFKFKTFSYSRSGTYTVTGNTVIIEYEKTDEFDWSKTKTVRETFTREGNGFRYNGFSDVSILLKKIN